MAEKIYTVGRGEITDEVVERFCTLFAPMACKRKLIDKEGLRSATIEKFGIDVMYNKQKPGLTRIRFVTEDDMEVIHTFMVQDIAHPRKGRELIEAFYNDTVTAMDKYRAERKPLEIHSKEDDTSETDTSEDKDTEQHTIH